MDWKQHLVEKYEEELEDLYRFDPPEGWKSLVQDRDWETKWAYEIVRP